MRILYLSQYYPPELYAGAQRADANIKYLRNIEGLDFVVIAELPTHPLGKLPPGFRKCLFDYRVENAIKTIRVWTLPTNRKGFFSRIMQYFSYPITAFLAFCKIKQKFDLVVCSSPPPLGSLTAWIIAKYCKAKFVFDIRDVWPEAGYELNQIPKKLRFFAEKWADFIYSRVDAFIVVSPGIKRETKRRNNSKRISVVYNGVDIDNFKPIHNNSLRDKYRKTWGFLNKIVFVFAGTIGITSNIEFLIDVAERMHENAAFIFVGDGIRKEFCKEEIQKRKLENRIKLLDGVNHKELMKIFNACDVGIATLQPGEFWHWAIPTKIFTYWASSLPVISASIGDSAKIVENSGISFSVKPGDVNQMLYIVNEICNNPDKIKSYSLKTRDYVIENFSRKKQAKLFLRALKKSV